MTATDKDSVTFETTVAVTGNNTGIVVPSELIDRLGAGKRPAVFVDLTATSTAAPWG